MTDVRPKLHHFASSPVGELDDHSGSIDAANTSQVLMEANPNRVYWSVQNQSQTATLWVRPGGAANAGQPSLRVGPLEMYTPAFVDRREIQILCTTVGVEFTCKEG